jgi:hypothetical protein
MRICGCFGPGEHSPVVVDDADCDLRSANIDCTDHEVFPSLILTSSKLA